MKPGLHPAMTLPSQEPAEGAPGAPGREQPASAAPASLAVTYLRGMLGHRRSWALGPFIPTRVLKPHCPHGGGVTEVM